MNIPFLYKPQTVTRSQPRLKRQQEFSDLSLTSIDGKVIHCHRCVLVARSGEQDNIIRTYCLLLTPMFFLFSDYFRSMLLMGWKEVSYAVVII